MLTGILWILISVVCAAIIPGICLLCGMNWIACLIMFIVFFLICLAGGATCIASGRASRWEEEHREERQQWKN